MPDIQRIDFHGNDLLSWRDGEEVSVSIREMCQSIGISPQTQLEKLRQNPVFAKGIRSKAILTPGGTQEVYGLLLDLLPGWLATISPARIKDPHIRATLVQYQEESYKALKDYWTTGKAERDVSITPTRALLQTVQRMVELEEELSEVKFDLAAVKESVAAIQDEQPPAGRMTCQDWLFRNQKPRLPKEVWQALQRRCKRYEVAIPFTPKGMLYPLWYHTPEVIERAYGEVTKQLSFICEAQVPYGRKRTHG